MPGAPLPPFQKEVQDFARTCEHLLAAAKTLSFAEDELAIMRYYAIEVAKTVGAIAELKIDATTDKFLHRGNGTS